MLSSNAGQSNRFFKYRCSLNYKSSPILTTDIQIHCRQYSWTQANSDSWDGKV